MYILTDAHVLNTTVSDMNEIEQPLWLTPFAVGYI